MAIAADGGVNFVECPECGSKAVYRYGTVHRGLQRYLCLICGRQFVPGHQRDYPKTRPDCPTCGAGMHVFKKPGDGRLVFRCSRYPECRTYAKQEPDRVKSKRGNRQ